MAWCKKYQCEMTGFITAFCPKCDEEGTATSEKPPVAKASGGQKLQKWWVRFTKYSASQRPPGSVQIKGNVTTFDSKRRPALKLDVYSDKNIDVDDLFCSFGNAQNVTIWGQLNDRMVFEIELYVNGWV